MTKQMKKTDRIFLKALSRGLDGRILEEDPGISEEEWEAVLVLSAEQSLLPLVFEAVYPLLPEELERKYRAHTLSWVTGQVRASEEFLGTYRALSERGIRPLVFKGIVCRSLYPLPDLRVSADEDLYIRKEDYMDLHGALKSLGFACREPNFRSEHETVYQGKDLVIEGHWDLFPRENALWEKMNALSEEILARAGAAEVEGTELLIPEPTDHMIYLLLHAMKHFSLAGVGVRQICDVVLWDRKHHVDWERVRDTMASLGGLRFTEALLDAGSGYFGMAMPESFEKADSLPLILDSLEGGTFGWSSEDRRRSASITSAESVSGHGGALPLFRALFPSRAVMEINYPWISKSPLLLPAGWGVRLLRYAGRIGKEASPLDSIRIGQERAELLKEYGLFRPEGKGEKDE